MAPEDILACTVKICTEQAAGQGKKTFPVFWPQSSHWSGQTRGEGEVEIDGVIGDEEGVGESTVQPVQSMTTLVFKVVGLLIQKPEKFSSSKSACESQ